MLSKEFIKVIVHRLHCGEQSRKNYIYIHIDMDNVQNMDIHTVVSDSLRPHSVACQASLSKGLFQPKSNSGLPGFLLCRQILYHCGEGNGNPLQYSCPENPNG